jgi:hypothetical protein
VEAREACGGRKRLVAQGVHLDAVDEAPVEKQELGQEHACRVGEQRRLLTPR